MLTLQQLKDMEPDTIFASGYTTDDAKGINMQGSGKTWQWVAIRGSIHDWSIYAMPAPATERGVAEVGIKVHSRTTIAKLVPADDEALDMYRD